MVAAMVAAACDPVSAPDGTAQVSSRVDMVHSGVSKTVLGPTPSVRWRHRFGEHDRVGSPLIVGDLVVAPVVTTQAVEDAPNLFESYVVAFDRVTGEQRWRTPSLSPYGRTLQIASAGGRVFASDNRDRLTGIDLATGAVLWTAEVYDDQSRPAVAVADEVYVSTNSGTAGAIWSFDARTGALRWKQEVPYITGDSSSPAVSGDAVYVAGACGVAQAMRRRDGAVLWHHLGDCYGGGGTDVIVRNLRLYAVDAGLGNAWTGYILSQQSGALLRTFETTLAPAVGTGNFVTLRLGVLENRTVDGGTVRWRRRFGSVEAPVVAGQTVLGVVSAPDPGDYAAPRQGSLVGVRIADGGEVFRMPLGAFPEQYSTTGWETVPRLAVANHTVALAYGPNELVVAG
jgi:outer membrane protein assembly factor BamB